MWARAWWNCSVATAAWTVCRNPISSHCFDFVGTSLRDIPPVFRAPSAGREPPRGGTLPHDARRKIVSQHNANGTPRASSPTDPKPPYPKTTPFSPAGQTAKIHFNPSCCVKMRYEVRQQFLRFRRGGRLDLPEPTATVFAEERVFLPS